jgi:hypothetical protein
MVRDQVFGCWCILKSSDDTRKLTKTADDTPYSQFFEWRSEKARNPENLDHVVFGTLMFQ